MGAAPKLYNTLTRRVEPLQTINPGEVRMYTCGPTVYHYVHIGNFRTFVFQDVLRRYLKYKGYSLLHVMNITDVEDKIIENAREQGVTIKQYTADYEAAFLEDMSTLRIQQPELMPKATDHIPEMLDLILKLQHRNLVYQREGSTYFRIASFPSYGRLSRLDPAQLGTSQKRTESDEYGKDNPRDFALWKASRQGEHFWESPLGPGRPGWHLECSAMSMKYLGGSFDIHCGGIDLIFPHHENEIAQSEGATGQSFVRHWLHAAHLIVDGQKMSKSLGNFFTLRDLLARGCGAEALRYLLCSVHYRKQLNFTFEGVQQAQSSIQRINDFLLRVREVSDSRISEKDWTDRLEQAQRDFEAALDDDLNTSAALAAVFELVKDGNVQLEKGRIGPRGRDQILRFFGSVNQIFDVFQVESEELEDTAIAEMISEREKARSRREFKLADEIRDELARRGILLEDTKEGTRWKRR